MNENSHLPYTDTKPVGAADFYFAINATFRFILNRFGKQGLQKYWTEMGEKYYAPVSALWKREGLSGVAKYWKEFFDAEPGADVEIHRTNETVVLDIKTCPAIAHLRKHQREIVPCFCEHCFFVSDAAARPANLTVRIEGGNGTCRQIFSRRDDVVSPQDFSKIKEAV
jgi:hypothetical protein